MTQPQPQENPRILRTAHQKCLPVPRFDMNFEHRPIKWWRVYLRYEDDIISQHVSVFKKLMAQHHSRNTCMISVSYHRHLISS